jgi:hypothetical protein
MQTHEALTGAAHRQPTSTTAKNAPERIMVASTSLMAGGRVKVSVLPMMVCCLGWLLGSQKGRMTAVHATETKGPIYTADGLLQHSRISSPGVATYAWNAAWKLEQTKDWALGRSGRNTSQTCGYVRLAGKPVSFR